MEIIGLIIVSCITLIVIHKVFLLCKKYGIARGLIYFVISVIIFGSLVVISEILKHGH